MRTSLEDVTLSTGLHRPVLNQNQISLISNNFGKKKSGLKCSYTSTNFCSSLHLAILVAESLCVALKHKTKHK